MPTLTAPPLPTACAADTERGRAYWPGTLRAADTERGTRGMLRMADTERGSRDMLRIADTQRGTRDMLRAADTQRGSRGMLRIADTERGSRGMLRIADTERGTRDMLRMADTERGRAYWPGTCDFACAASAPALSFSLSLFSASHLAYPPNGLKLHPIGRSRAPRHRSL